MKLLDEIQVGKLTFKNRVMFPPLTTGYEDHDGAINKQSFNFYKRLAEGGTGYIVIGDVAPVNNITPTPKLFDDSQIGTFARLADAVHEFGSKLGVQIFYPEYEIEALRILFGKGDRAAAYAKLHHDMDHFVNEVSVRQLMEVVDKIAACAARAYQAGVDVIQVHGDRLVGALSSPLMNHRTDEYGGTLVNRTRFALQVVEAIKAAAPEVCIDYKLSIISTNPVRGRGGLFIDDGIELARMLETAGVDMLHVAQANHTGNMGDTIPAMGCQPYSFFANYSALVKQAVSVPVSTVGRIFTPENGEALIAQGKCDIVGLARPLLSDPDYVNKLIAHQPETIRHCISCNKGCTDLIQERKFVSCILNAENGYEYERMITPTAKCKKVVVVGGGPAGLEAARVARTKGHEVVLFEKKTYLGGQLILASVPPRKNEMARATNYLCGEITRLGVELRLGHEASPEMVEKENPDAVIVAVGSHNVIPPIGGVNLPHVLDAWKILANESICSGRIVVVGGGLVGVETAELLADAGCQVSIVEMLDEMAKEESSTVKPTLLESFDKHGVKLFVKTKVEEITLNSVECTCEGKSVSLPCDYVVMAAGARPNTFDISLLESKGIQVIAAGDCNQRASNINNAIEQGYLAANSL